MHVAPLFLRTLFLSSRREVEQACITESGCVLWWLCGWVSLYNHNEQWPQIASSLEVQISSPASFVQGFDSSHLTSAASLVEWGKKSIVFALHTYLSWYLYVTTPLSPYALRIVTHPWLWSLYHRYFRSMISREEAK